MAFALGILLVSGLQHDIGTTCTSGFSGRHIGFSDLRSHQQNFKKTDPCLKPRKYKTFSESDSNVMSTFISKGRNNKIL